MQFATRILSFVESINLSSTDRKELLTALVQYALQIHGTQRATVLRKLAFRLDRMPEVMYFKNQYLDVSSYIHRNLWKSVVGFLQTSEVDQEIKSDVDYCLGLLTDADRSVLKVVGLNESSSVEDFDIAKWAEDKNILQWVRSKIYKLKFIAHYDPGIDLEDFAQDLACEVVRVINTYQRIKVPDEHAQGPLQTRLEKCIDGALNNKIGSLIERHTSLSRRRSVSTNDELYKQLKSTKKKLNKTKKVGDVAAIAATEAKVKKIAEEIQNTESDYFAQTSSIEPTTEIGTHTLHLNSWVDFTNTEDKLNEALWAEKIPEVVNDPRDRDYLKLVLEDPEIDTDFEKWAGDRKVKKTDNVNNRLRLAHKFIVEQDKNGYYAGLPKWNKNSMMKNENLLRMFA